MRYVIAVIVGLTILAFGSPVFADDHTWQRPAECEDKDRESPGNRSTPCKYVLPPLEKVEYIVHMVYPSCWEALVFRFPGLKPLPEDMFLDGAYTEVTLVRTKADFYGKEAAWIEQLEIFDGAIVNWGASWGLGDAVSRNDSYFYSQIADYPYIRLSFAFGPSIREKQGIGSTTALHPDTDNTVELANACLALVAQEKANREHAAEVERQEAAETARIEAERDAAAKEEEQAQREAEAQARIAEQQLAAANEQRLAIARAEEIRTQTLIDEIALQEVLTEILNDIVRIRLAGQEDRARITNEYLARARAASESFDLETSEIESRVQEYIDFNAALLAEIAEYRLSIQNRLEGLRASIEDQRAEIDKLEAEAREIAVPVEEPGENVEEDQNGNGNG